MKTTDIFLGINLSPFTLFPLFKFKNMYSMTQAKLHKRGMEKGEIGLV